MKSLVVSAHFPLSESDFVGSFIRDEACELAKKGVDVHVGRWVHMSERVRAESRTIDGVSVHDVKFSLANFLFASSSFLELPRSFLFKLKETGILLSYGKGVEKLVRKHDPDIIHAHFAYPEGFAGVLAKRRTQRPLLVTLHGYDVLVEPTVNYGCRLDLAVDRVVRTVLTEADGVIAASSATYDAALELGCSSDKLALIPNGVDLRRFALDTDRWNAGRELKLGENPVVFTLGGHEPQKGIEYLIRAAPLVLREVPDAVFVVGGDGSLRSHHESLANELGVRGNVVFTGRIPRERVPSFYAACDVFVLPSIIEAFGLVLIEAMASRKPVVGTNVGGTPDTITDGLNGFLVNSRDSAGLAERIVWLLKDSRLREEMGKAGREMVERKFNMQERINRIIKLYDSLK